MHSTLTGRCITRFSSWLLLACPSRYPRWSSLFAITHTTLTSNPSITIARYFVRHSRRILWQTRTCGLARVNDTRYTTPVYRNENRSASAGRKSVYRKWRTSKDTRDHLSMKITRSSWHSRANNTKRTL